RRSRLDVLARHAAAGGARAGADSRAPARAARRAVHRPRRRLGVGAGRAAARSAAVGQHRDPGDSRSRPRRPAPRPCAVPARRAAGGVAAAPGGAPRDLSERHDAGPRRGRRVSTPFARAVWLVLRKDLTIEVRSREIAYTTLFFAVSCVL